VATACTSGAEDPEPAPSSSPASPTSSSAAPVTLRFAVYGAPEVLAAYRQLASTYTGEHPNVTVKVEAAEDQVTSRDLLERAFDQGTPPDVFLTPQTMLPSLVSQGRVQPVDELMEERGVEFGDTYQRLGLEAFAAEAALQCMPNDVSPYVVYYNKRLLVPESLAEPGEKPLTPETGWTWEQFTKAARQTSRADVKGVYLAPRLSTLIPLVRSAGEDVVDDPREPTTLTMADEGTRTALEEILTVARDPSLNPTLKQLARQDAETRFENGRLGMLIGTRELVPRLRAKPDLHFDVFPLPSLGRSRTLAEITGYCVAKDSAHVADAADFLAYAVGEDGSKIMAGSGAIVPSNLAALHSPSFTEPSRFPRNSVVYDEVIRRADAMPWAPGWPDVVSQTQPFLVRMFYAPLIDLDTLLPRIDEVAAAQLERPEESPSASP
jgi:multiple sugar transport system substrate-binding protein